MQVHPSWSGQNPLSENQLLVLFVVVGSILILGSYGYRFTVTDQHYDATTHITPVVTVAEETDVPN